jgi:hypothetical protein
MKRGLAIGLMVAIAVVVGVGAFFAGRATGGSMSPQAALTVLQNLDQQQRAQLFQNGGLGSLFGSATRGSGVTGGTSGTGGTFTRGGGFTSGSIISKDANSITVKDSSGNTHTVYYSSTTTISKTSDVTSDALTVGQDVTVTGTSNSDGSETATRILLGAAGAFGPGGGGPNDTGGTQGTGGTGSATGGSTPTGSTTPGP